VFRLKVFIFAKNALAASALRAEDLGVLLPNVFGVQNFLCIVILYIQFEKNKYFT
jgi:hypothetical protein